MVGELIRQLSLTLSDPRPGMKTRDWNAALVIHGVPHVSNVTHGVSDH